MWKTALTSLILGLFTGAAAAEVLSTIDLVDAEASPWGQNDTPIYGQIVTFAEPVTLHSFEVLLDDGNAPIGFNAMVHAWVAGSALGPALATASGTTLGTTGFQHHSINFDETTLPAGDYVILVEATSPGIAKFATAENALETGAWVYVSADTDVSLTDHWFVSGTTDLAFQIVYDPVTN